MESSTNEIQDRGSRLLAIYWAESAVAILVVFLRFYGRIMIQKLGPDDYTMAFTVLLLVILSCFVTHFADIGGCRHLNDLSAAERIQAIKYFWISQPWGTFGFATGKISVALMILQITGPSTIWRKWILYFAVASVFVINVIGCFVTVLQCSPPKALWTPDESGHCWKPVVQWRYAVFLSSWNIAIDVLLAILPATLIYNLNLSRAKRISLSVLLGLGLLAAICGAVKIKYLASLTARSDLTWETYNLYAWSASELFVIIVCGSIPPIKPLYDRLVGSAQQQRQRRRLRSGYISQSDSSAQSYELKRKMQARNARGDIEGLSGSGEARNITSGGESGG